MSLRKHLSTQSHLRLIRSIKPKWFTHMTGPLWQGKQWLIGSVITLTVIMAVEHFIGWINLVSSWQNIPIDILLAALSAVVISYFFRAIRVYILFQPIADKQFLRILRLSILHNTANNLLPMRTGELVFPWLMQRNFGVGLIQSGSLLLWIRLLDLHYILAMVGVAFWLKSFNPAYLVLTVVWLSLLIFISPTYVAKLRKSVRPESFVAKILEALIKTSPKSRRQTAYLYLWTVLSWSVKIAGFTLLLGYFISAETWQLMAGVIGADISSVLPFHGVAGGGSYEAAVLMAMAPLGVSAQSALHGAINLHLFVLGSTLVTGLCALCTPTRHRVS